MGGANSWIRARGLLVVCGLACAVPAAGQGGPDVQIDPDNFGLYQCETAMTLNPAMPGNIAVCYNDDPFSGNGLGIAFSVDGGATWANRQLPIPLPQLIAYFDPMIAADTQGRLYAGGCAWNGVLNGESGIYLYESPDSGNSWLPILPPVSYDAPGTQTLNDRGHLIVDDTPTSPFVDNVYVSWIRDVGTTGSLSDCWFSWAPPGGTPFGTRQQISATSTQVHAPHLAAASDGTLYCVWVDYDVTLPQDTNAALYFQRSTDGGQTWLLAEIRVGQAHVPPLTLTTVSDVFSDAYGPGTEGDTAPAIAVHPGRPQEVYVVYPADNDGAFVGDEGNIFFIASVDGGNTWGAPVQINAAPYDSGHQFAPWIDVKPDGTIDVAWYDGIVADRPVEWNAVVSRSGNGGASWTRPYPVGDQWAIAPLPQGAVNRWLGEYLALCVDEAWAHVSFCSSRFDPAQYGNVFYDRVLNRVIGGGIPTSFAPAPVQGPVTKQPLGAWSENFDSYAAGGGLHGQGGWKGWGNDVAFDATVSSTQSRSSPNAVDISGDADLVHEHVADSGRWTYSVWQYIPADFTSNASDPLAGTYFIVLNTYADDGPFEDGHWSIQMQFDSNDGMLKVYYGNGLDTVDTPFVTDRWVQIEARIDLNHDWVDIYYDRTLVTGYVWTDGVLGTGGGAARIGAVDLFANGSSTVYYDDFRLRPGP